MSALPPYTKRHRAAQTLPLVYSSCFHASSLLVWQPPCPGCSAASPNLLVRFVWKFAWNSIRIYREWPGKLSLAAYTWIVQFSWKQFQNTYKRWVRGCVAAWSQQPVEALAKGTRVLCATDVSLGQFCIFCLPQLSIERTPCYSLTSGVSRYQQRVILLLFSLESLVRKLNSILSALVWQFSSPLHPERVKEVKFNSVKKNF